ncbi:MAG TPA: tRNA adenosine(34) deaminase TadA [Kiritimatiellia bacterium]|nr:tRNA adenosine(34) deaminase TadA [Kiritimatiellia bacterium]HRZ13729.1 tRNA adenosine(34) deaminase TadA [Kiritimatiellia bacterium]HSA19363.1 tRNA adenosine(34) deaminase TadA [Kiritimatiellia bacterium]
MPPEIDNRTPASPHERFMRLALRQARAAADLEEVPVGAVIVREGQLIAQAHNQVELLKDPTAHAEILAITQAAAALQDWRLAGTILYVTKEPCPMCAGAIVLARIPRVVWGVADPARGGAVSLFPIFQNPRLNHRVEFEGGVLEEECRGLLQDFFRKHRADRAAGSAGASRGGAGADPADGRPAPT